jgi:repressor LexA
MRSKNEAVFGEIVEFVNRYFEKNGRSPSIREIEGEIGLSHVTVQRYLQVLRERGEIEYDGHRSIVTEHIREMLDTSRVQMGSSIPCGALDDVIDEEIEHLRLPKSITGEGEFFLLRARGESMIKAGIDDGDLVLIRKQETAKQGNIVAFLYDNQQTTLKRYKQSEDAIYLCPENDSMQPIAIKGEDRAKLRIQGVAIGIYKKL